MAIRSSLLAVTLMAASVPALAANEAPTHTALASVIQTAAAVPLPLLRADVKVTGDVVRIGDVIDNAGSAAQIAIYRAPEPGTTGTLAATQVLDALRAHQVIGVDAHGIRNVSVTRLARTLDADDIELQIAVALEHRNGLALFDCIAVVHAQIDQSALHFGSDVALRRFDRSRDGDAARTIETADGVTQDERDDDNERDEDGSPDRNTSPAECNSHR